jgi:hypothetical protein
VLYSRPNTATGYFRTTADMEIEVSASMIDGEAGGVAGQGSSIYYHGRMRYAGPALPISISGGGLSPQVVRRTNGGLGCSLCSSVLSREALLIRHFAKHRIGEFICPFVKECRANKLRIHRWDKFREHLQRYHLDVDLDDPTVIEVFMVYHRGAKAQMGKLGQNQQKKRLTKAEKEAIVGIATMAEDNRSSAQV